MKRRDALLTPLMATALSGIRPVFAQNGTPKPLVLGVVPYFSPAKLVEVLAPLRVYLADRLTQPVSLVTAPDYVQFDRRTREGAYDVVMTAPHLARRAEKDAQWQRVAMSGSRSLAVLVALRTSPLRHLADLQGRTLALPPKEAIVHQLSLRLLSDAGLQPPNIQLRTTASHNNALELALNGETDAAAFGEPTWQSQPEAVRQRLHVLGRSASITGFMVMAHPRLSAERLGAITQALLGLNTHPVGAAFFERSGMKSFVPVDEKDMRQMDTFDLPSPA